MTIALTTLENILNLGKLYFLGNYLFQHLHSHKFISEGDKNANELLTWFCVNRLYPAVLADTQPLPGAALKHRCDLFVWSLNPSSSP